MNEFADRYFPFLLRMSTALTVVGLLIGIMHHLATGRFGVAILLRLFLGYIAYVILAGMKYDDSVS